MTNPTSRFAAWLVLMGLLALPLISDRARAQALITDLSQDQIAIRSNFTGAKVLLFGAMEAEPTAGPNIEHDIVVVVRGPIEKTTVRRKEQVAGIWINREEVTFESAPGYYAVASTRPLELIASPALRKEHKIGLEYVGFGQAIDGTGTVLSASEDAQELAAFEKALIRNRREEGLFDAAPGTVDFLGQTLFRVDVTLPANVPLGLYTATVYLFSEGELLHQVSTPLFIDKQGLERFLYRVARTDSLIYGVVAILTAALAGFAGATVLRERD